MSSPRHPIGGCPPELMGFGAPSMSTPMPADVVEVDRCILAAASYIIQKTEHADSKTAAAVRDASLQKTEQHKSPVDCALFLNMLRSLHNIDGYQLSELIWGEQIDFVQNPVKYFIQAEDDQQAAIWREVSKRQPAEATYGGIPIADHARSSGLAGWHPGDDA